MVSLPNEYRACGRYFDTGQDAALARREKEIERLERLVWDAVDNLQEAGLERESAKLRRALERSSR